MTTYEAPLNDMQFVLNEVLQISKYSNLPGFSEASDDVVAAILEEGAKLASNVLHPINHSGDKEGCTPLAQTNCCTAHSPWRHAG